MKPALGSAPVGRAEKVHLGVAEVASLRGEELAPELVPGLVLVDELPDARMVDVDRVRPEVDRELALDAQDVAEAHRPVVREVARAEKPVDERGALAGVRRRDVGERLFLRGDAPGEVEVEPASLATARRRRAPWARRRRPPSRQGKRVLECSLA